MRMACLVFCVCLMFVATVQAEPRTIQFAGETWKVREGKGGPGPNVWSNDPKSVWGDSDGRLHLKLRQVDGVWNCAELIREKSFGYGEYLFQLTSNVEKFDPNVVVGLFTYADDTHEIDIELSRWGKSENAPAQFVIQPGEKKGNKERFKLNLTGDNSSHRFTWKPGAVDFQSFHGHYDAPPSKNFLIHEWTTSSPNVPEPGKERLTINLWLQKGKPPTDGREVELIVRTVKFTPFSK